MQPQKNNYCKLVRFPNTIKRAIELGAFLEEKSANKYIVCSVLDSLRMTMETYQEEEDILKDTIKDWRKLLEDIKI